MKFRCFYMAALLLALCLCVGCSFEQNQAPMDITSPTEPNYSTIETVSIPNQSVMSEATESMDNTLKSLEIEPGSYQMRYENGSEYMDYYLFVPKNAVEDMPIVVFLHGSVEIAQVELLENYGIVSVVHSLYGDQFPFLLLLPCTHKPSWTANGVPETLTGLIDQVAETYRADKGRISITGHSLGSVGTWKMLSLYADYFSAGVPVSCGIDEEIDFNRCAKVPIRAFAGTVGTDEKNYNPAMHKLVTSINDAGGDALMCTIDGADHEAMVTAAYTEELLEWMISQ